MQNAGLHQPIGQSRGREFGREITNAAAQSTNGNTKGLSGEFPPAISLPQVGNMTGSQGQAKRLAEVPTSATAQQSSKMVSYFIFDFKI